MKCCGTSSNEQSDKKSKEIEDELKKTRKEIHSKLKLLLLGTGDSGKSTFLKQMKMLHKKGFPTREVIQFQIVLQDNLLSSMQKILINEKVLQSISNLKEVMEDREVVLSSLTLSPCVPHIERLWALSSIKDAFENRSDLCIQIPSTADYFFQNATRIAAEEYQPTPEDIFRAKLKTTGISEITFQTEGVEITIVDVGGQRSERRKWLHCFDNVQCVIYLAALDEYNMKLEEDNSTNRFEESLNLFREMTASQYFKPASWMLFLNKSDIFEKKIERWPIKNYFKNCSATTYGESISFIKNLYEKQFKGQSKGENLYVHVTCAIDTQNCKRVFLAVKDTILRNALSAQGVL